MPDLVINSEATRLNLQDNENRGWMKKRKGQMKVIFNCLFVHHAITYRLRFLQYFFFPVFANGYLKLFNIKHISFYCINSNDIYKV